SGNPDLIRAAVKKASPLVRLPRSLRLLQQLRRCVPGDYPGIDPQMPVRSVPSDMGKANSNLVPAAWPFRFRAECVLYRYLCIGITLSNVQWCDQRHRSSLPVSWAWLGVGDAPR